MIFSLLLDAAQDAGSNSGTSGTENGGYGSIIIMAVLVVAIIGLFIWSSISNKKKRKQAQEQLNSIRIGDRVKTIGGICGFIVELNDAENTFVLETGSEGNKCHMKFDKGAIYQTSHVGADNKETPITKKAEEQVEEKAEVKEETTDNK